MRRRTLLIVVALAVLVGGWISQVSTTGRPEGCLSECEVGTRQPGPLRVLSMNVLHGFPGYDRQGERLDLVGQEIARRSVDVALLQEVPWNPWVGSGVERLAKLTGLNHVFLRANGNRYAIAFEEGSAILSRFPLRDVGWVELSPAAGAFEHRVALAATVATPDGDVRLVVTHLAGGPADVNAGQARSLVDWLATIEGPLIVGGDFNAVPGSSTYRLLTGALTDAFWSVHPDDPGWTCCIDHLAAPPGTRMRRRVDYVFVRDISPAAAGVVLLDPVPRGDGWLRASDHAGLYLELEGQGIR